MKHFVLVGVLVAALGVSVVHAQKAADRNAAPKDQPASGAAASVPSGELALGSINLTRSVKADGRELKAGTYQVRLTGQSASPDAKGATAAYERWIEFVQGKEVKGREVVSIIPQAEIAQVQKDPPPAPNSAKVEVLKDKKYLRVWINRGGNHYLVHFPA